MNVLHCTIRQVLLLSSKCKSNGYWIVFLGKIIFYHAEMMSRSNCAARGQNLFSKMAYEEKSLATPGL
jgi:hypothetical protein